MLEITDGMSAELWTILGVGVAVIGLHWRMAGMVSDLSQRIDAFYAEIASVKKRLTAVQTTLGVLLKGCISRCWEEAARSERPIGTASVARYRTSFASMLVRACCAKVLNRVYPSQPLEQSPKGSNSQTSL